jgi:hypothetical protein
VWTIIIGGGAAFWIACALTQSWPRKGPGGGYGTNIAGPGIAILAMLVTMFILGKLLRRRTPLQPPQVGFDDRPRPVPPTSPAAKKP